MPQILAIDQGTTNSKAILVDESGRVLARGSASVELRCPQPGWAESDADALWAGVMVAVDRCLEAAGESVEIAAVAVTNQRESTVAWDRATGRPIGPVVGWQCRRTALLCEEVRAAGLGPMIEARTGLPLDPLSSAGKFRWLLDEYDPNRARSAAGELCVGTVDSWLLWNLTGGAVFETDASNASRTQLFDIERRAWGDELLEAFRVPRTVLAEVLPSNARFGLTRQIGRLPAGIQIAAIMGDSHAALFGHGAVGVGATKATYGTGSSLMCVTPKLRRSSHGLSGTIAWALADPADDRSLANTTYALEGNISVSGMAVRWMGEILGLADPDSELAELASTVADNGQVYFVPAFVGLGAPRWDPDACGVIVGLTRGAGRGHLARACFEAIAYQVRDVFDALTDDLGAPPDVLLADGGASQSDLLMQIQADLLAVPVQRNPTAELSALGVAHMAGLAVGMWDSVADLGSRPNPANRFEPKLAPSAREVGYKGWLAAVERASARGAGSDRRKPLVPAVRI
jgi:glycerol kinase